MRRAWRACSNTLFEIKETHILWRHLGAHADKHCIAQAAKGAAPLHPIGGVQNFNFGTSLMASQRSHEFPDIIALE